MRGKGANDDFNCVPELSIADMASSAWLKSVSSYSSATSPETPAFFHFNKSPSHLFLCLFVCS